MEINVEELLNKVSEQVKSFAKTDVVIGEEFQKDHIEYFNKTEMVIIKNAGHSMIGEKPQDCLVAIRKYFNEQ